MGENDPRFQTEMPSTAAVVGGTTEPAGHVDTVLQTGDTGLGYGPGQSTGTGNLPTQGYANMDGTERVLDSDDTTDGKVHSSLESISEMADVSEEDDLFDNAGLMMDDEDPELTNELEGVSEDDREMLVEKD